MKRAVLAFALVVSGCNAGSATPDPRPQTPGEAAALEHGQLSPAAGSAAPRAGDSPQRSSIADVGRLAGKPLYVALCAPCHGADGKGYAADRAPSLVNPTFLESASDDFLRRSIADGRPGTSMAAYRRARGGPLDDAAIDRLVAYLREQGPAAKPLPALATGDVATGSRVYAQRCFSCHGDAKTRGEAPSLANPQFQAAATDAFVRHAIARGRPGTKMEAFAGALSDAEIDGVVAYVRALPGGGDGPPVKQLPEPTGKEPLVINPGGRAPTFTLRADPCPAPLPGGPTTCKPDPRFVSVEQLGKAVAARQRLIIVDARPPSEWMRVHIAGAVSIPYHDMKRLDEVPRDGTWVITYCACPHHLSGIVVDELRRRGYAHSAVLDEGINEWHRRALPVVAADGVTAPPEPMPLPGQPRSK